MHDVVIRNASIVDGTGAPGYRGSVAIDGTRITAVGLVTDQGAREIEADGRVVCPGFIDVHTHSDLMLLAEPAHEPKVRQGVTTDLLGLDGIGYAPLADELQPSFRDYFAALNGDPPISHDWSTVAGWLDTFEGAAACNAAHHVPHGCVRAALVGWEDRRATPEELRAMQQITHEAFQDGAVALSTGLDYKPCAFADTDELVALSEVAAEFGAPYVPHMRYILGMRDAIRETMAIGRRAGCPVHISHYISSGQRWWKTWTRRTAASGRACRCHSTPMPIPRAARCCTSRSPTGRSRADRTKCCVAWRTRTCGRGSPRKWRTAPATTRSKSTGRCCRACRPVPIVTWKVGCWAMSPTSGTWSRMRSWSIWCGRSAGAPRPMFFNDQTDDDFAQIMRHPSHMVGSDAILLGDAPHPRTYGTYPRFLAAGRVSSGSFRWREWCGA